MIRKIIIHSSQQREQYKRYSKHWSLLNTSPSIAFILKLQKVYHSNRMYVNSTARFHEHIFQAKIGRTSKLIKLMRNLYFRGKSTFKYVKVRTYLSVEERNLYLCWLLREFTYTIKRRKNFEEFLILSSV